MKCTLCLSTNNSLFFQDQNRSYYCCQECHLIFVPKEQHLPEEALKNRYSFHQNNPDDEGYCQFLNTLLGPIEAYLKPQSKGLDYGCGPGPTIAKLMGKRGHQVENYDLFFAHDISKLERSYDFVTCTEVVEHFVNPHQDWRQLMQVSSGAVLGVMSSFYSNDVEFSSWYYKNDPTHVAFYQEKTIHYLKDYYQLELLEFNPRFAIFKSRESLV